MAMHISKRTGRIARGPYFFAHRLPQESAQGSLALVTFGAEIQDFRLSDTAEDADTPVLQPTRQNCLERFGG